MADQAPLCTREDLEDYGARADVLQKAPPERQDRTILARTGWVCSYLAERVQLPLTVWGEDIRQACAIAVVWDLTSGPIGRNPEALGEMDPLYLRYKGVERWLQAIADGGPMPMVVGTAAPIPPPNAGSAEVVTNTSRGWQDFGDHGGAFSGSRGGR